MQLALPAAPARARFKGDASDEVEGTNTSATAASGAATAETEEASFDEDQSESSDRDTSDSRQTSSHATGLLRSEKSSLFTHIILVMNKYFGHPYCQTEMYADRNLQVRQKLNLTVLKECCILPLFVYLKLPGNV